VLGVSYACGMSEFPVLTPTSISGALCSKQQPPATHWLSSVDTIVIVSLVHPEPSGSSGKPYSLPLMHLKSTFIQQVLTRGSFMIRGKRGFSISLLY
jgi:hypothetical protein